MQVYAIDQSQGTCKTWCEVAKVIRDARLCGYVYVPASRFLHVLFKHLPFPPSAQVPRGLAINDPGLRSPMRRLSSTYLPRASISCKPTNDLYICDSNNDLYVVNYRPTRRLSCSQ